MLTFKIVGRNIGRGCPVFIIAEAGVNHNGDIKLAHKLIDVAVEARVDAVKFQTFKSEYVVSTNAPKAKYQLKNTNKNESQIDMLRRLELSLKEYRQLQLYCQKRGIIFMSSPFDKKSVDVLDDLRVPVFKIGSGEINNLPFLEYIARKGKPIILSTGMSYLSEVEEAVKVIQNAGCKRLALLHCVSNYPALPLDANLFAIKTLEKTFLLPVGYSDHCEGINIALAAVGIGACIIEKHFTLDRSLPGPDHKASLEPHEFKVLVESIRSVESALGDGRKVPVANEKDVRQVARRSIMLRGGVEKGEKITMDKLIALRPAGGIPPNKLKLVVGREAKRNLKSGTILSFQDLK